MAKQVLSHVDIRVRDRERAVAFYDGILGALGHTREQSEQWVTYDASGERDDAQTHVWFGFTVDVDMTPGPTRIAFAADSCEEVDRVTVAALEIGARHVEGPEYAYGPDYYAVFFEDPDGNKLEVCCYGPKAGAAS